MGDREGDRGVDRVDGPGAGRDLLVDGVGAHLLAFRSVCFAGRFESNELTQKRS